VSAAQPSLKALFIGAVVVTALVLWGFPHFERWLQAQHASAVRMSALAGCRQPGELEQLHIVILQRDGRLVIDGCIYIGSRGTYGGGKSK